MSQPWSPAKATRELRSYAMNPGFDLLWTGHVRERMAERDLATGDILHILKFGVVFDEAEPATRRGCFKYAMECTTPNSNGRAVRMICIPSPDQPAVKIVTIMWVDGK